MSVYMKRLPIHDEEEMASSALTPPVSVIVPAYNEEKVIVENIQSLFHLNYPEYEVIVVNDGSTDDTLQVLIEHFDLFPVREVIRQQIPTETVINVYRSIHHPHLIVVDKENGGKSDALNAGINISNYPYFCGIDADSILEPESLIKTMWPIIEGAENVIACGGIVRIANGCKIENGHVVEVRLPKNKLALFQVVEYLRSFLMGRLGLSAMNSLLIISGAFGVFRKREVIEVGGYSTNNIGEDMELVVRLQKYLFDEKVDAKILFLPQPICWTEAPNNLKVLYQQRTRWHIGLLQTLLKHKKLMFNPKYKSMGLIVMPYFLLVELLGPTIELVGTIFIIAGLYFDIVNIPFAIMFFLLTLVFGVFLSICAVFLEEYNFRRYPRIRDLLTLSLFSVIENFGYRQLNAIWRTIAFFRYLTNKVSWGNMTRTGISKENKKTMNM